MRTQSLDQFCAWLEQTPLSQTIQTTAWIVPTVQTVHILAIAAVMGSVLMIDLRLLGILAREQSLARVSERFRPFIWWTLPILLATGMLMIIGEPVRSLENPIFQLKMALLIAAIAATLSYQRPRVLGGYQQPAWRCACHCSRVPAAMGRYRVRRSMDCLFRQQLKH